MTETGTDTEFDAETATGTVVVITGPVGSGKTTTAAALHDLLSDNEVPNALIDMDALRSAWPTLSPFNHELGYDNLASLAGNYARHGIRLLCVADVVEMHEQRRRYELAAPGARVVIVRLRVPLDELERRLRARETAEHLEWYLLRAPELQQMQDDRAIGDLVLDVTDHTPSDLARTILTRLDLPTADS